MTDNGKNGNISYKTFTGWLVVIVIALFSAGYVYLTDSTATRLDRIDDSLTKLTVSVAVLQIQVQSVKDYNEKDVKEIKSEIQEIKKHLN